MPVFPPAEPKHVVDIGKPYPNPEALKYVYGMLKLFTGIRSECVIRMIRLIHERPGISQIDIVIKVRYKEQNQVSRLLTELEDYGMIYSTPKGKCKHYFLSLDRFESIARAIKMIKPTRMRHEIEALLSSHPEYA